jgi:hypothetical protein
MPHRLGGAAATPTNDKKAPRKKQRALTELYCAYTKKESKRQKNKYVIEDRPYWAMPYQKM